MNEIPRIVDLLEREHTGEPWHGSPLAEILKGIGHTQAAARPLPKGHSIWELVLHIAAWKNETRHRLSGAQAGDPEEGDWPSVGEMSASAWAKALEHLELSHRLLVSAVRDLPEPQLFEATNDPRFERVPATYYELLHGIVQHDVYHAGQIAILKKAV
jgi:uncharacterized damage-inducible protein DinB